jgi:hypothetical protein
VPPVNVRTKIDFIVRAPPAPRVLLHPICPLPSLPITLPLSPYKWHPLNPSSTHALLFFFTVPPHFSVHHRYRIPPPNYPMAAVSGPSTARHPSPFRKAQKISRPSAANAAHGPASVCIHPKFNLLRPSFSRLRRRRVLAGVTRIMDTSTQPSCVVVSYPIYLPVPTSPLPLRHLPPRQPPGWIIS